MGAARPIKASPIPAGTPSAPATSAEQDQAKERELILAVRAGDQDALGILYQTHRAKALAFALSLVRDGHDAEDVFHEAFTKTMNALTNEAGPSDNFLAYLNTAIRSTAASSWRRGSRELPAETMDLDRGAALDPRMEAITDRAGNEQVLAALQSLPERWQKVLWHADVLQEKPRHIAPLMGIAPNAVSALVRRARQGLRAAYADVLDTPADTGDHPES
jgi:RNA polymerase sigma factor (sigma-70 family)